MPFYKHAKDIAREEALFVDLSIAEGKERKFFDPLRQQKTYLFR